MPRPQPVSAVVDKLRRLPPERVAEVEDFIDFLASRDPDRGLVRAAQAVSASSLHAVWENDADADYDQL